MPYRPAMPSFRQPAYNAPPPGYVPQNLYPNLIAPQQSPYRPPWMANHAQYTNMPLNRPPASPGNQMGPYAFPWYGFTYGMGQNGQPLAQLR